MLQYLSFLYIALINEIRLTSFHYGLFFVEVRAASVVAAITVPSLKSSDSFTAANQTARRMAVNGPRGDFSKPSEISHALVGETPQREAARLAVNGCNAIFFFLGILAVVYINRPQL